MIMNITAKKYFQTFDFFYDAPDKKSEKIYITLTEVKKRKKMFVTVRQTTSKKYFQTLYFF